QHVPEIEIEFLVADLAHRWEIRQAGEAVAADNGVSLDFTGLDQRSGDHGRYRTQIGDARQQIVERGPRAAIRNLRDRRADLLADQHACQMTERADAGMRDLGVLSWLLHPAHELRDIVGWQARTRGERRQRGVDKSDRDEILLGVEAEVRVE